MAWVALLVPKVLTSVCHLTWVSFVLISAFSSLSHRAGEHALPHPTQREMSSAMGCCPLLRTALRGRETGLNGHTPGLWMASQDSGGCGVLLPCRAGCAIIVSQAKQPLSSYSTAQVLAFLGCGNLFFRVVHPHMEQDLAKTMGTSWRLAALAGTQLTADDLIHAW